MKTKLTNLLRGFIYETAYYIIDLADVALDWAATKDDSKRAVCSTCLQEIPKVWL